MTFSDQTDTWFDKLAECKLGRADVDSLRAAIAREPDKGALLELRYAAASLPAECAAPLTAHIDAVAGEKFADEFAFHFPVTGGEVSAAGELFSMVRQALDYIHSEH